MPRLPSRKLRVIMTAAHGASNSELIPLGGGAAICERLCSAWTQSADDIELTLVAPNNSPQPGVKLKYLDVLHGQAPSSLSEWQYAKFCREFEAAATEYILQQRPDVVLTHDIAEAPSFALLERYGIPCVPILHVDVVDFFCKMYLKGVISPRRAEAFASCLRAYPVMPDILRLVFDKQAEATQFCPFLVVPSLGCQQIMLDTYPGLGPEKVAVIPWGAPPQSFTEEQILEASQELLGSLGITSSSPVICTLSRISPEKGLDRLLASLQYGQLQGQIPAGLTVVICGQAAYMQGQGFMRKLREQAQAITAARVVFAGHLAGPYKLAMLRRANLFVTASVHESYGLTTMEAMSASTGVLATDTVGSRQTVDDSCGCLLPIASLTPETMWEAIRQLFEHPDKLAQMGQAAYAKAAANPSSLATARLFDLLCQASATGVK